MSSFIKSVILLIVFLAVAFVGNVYPKTISIGSGVFISGDKSADVKCFIQDIGGAGMLEGKMKFRAAYEDGTYSAWTLPEKYADTVTVTLGEIVSGKKFYIQGLFADSLENWQDEGSGPKTNTLLELDDTPPASGSIILIINAGITVN